MSEPTLTDSLIADHGLKPDEYQRILDLIGREPTFTELGIFSAMWNEHCSYKSSKKWLRTLPTEGPQVICGPGENAGIIDIGDGQACVFKMESHNHPSFIEPYQGAATGVGGILRDVFTMGARPVAALNALRFGATDHPKTRSLVKGVVEGIGGYGNCFGVPTVGGEVEFHPSYNGNPLVNAMAVGLADADKIFYSAASGIGMPIVYLGAKTGRDGVGGATMASAEFGEDAEEKRPTVQVGDPFTEKRLLEATLELMASGSVISIQDMGAAGLTCSAVEMGDKGNLGVVLDLEKVPTRELNMSAYEMMLSESQERMLMVLRPEKEAEAKAIFDKWDLDFAIVGETIEEDRFLVRLNGETKADLPLKALSGTAPEYDRPWVPTPTPATVSDVPAMDTGEALLKLVGSSDLASRRWVWEQYDNTVMADTIQLPGGDAAVVRVHGTEKALAMSADVTPRYCFADPTEGGKQAVAEAFRNICAVGARPLAATDNLNFGNPEKPEIMGQLVGCIKGIGEACAALDMPIVSGNVSLYNETEGTGILPTPTIGGVGLLTDSAKMMTVGFKGPGQPIVLIGAGSGGHMGQSLYLRELFGREEGAPPPVNLNAERLAGELVQALIENGLITACHDVSDGGLGVALAEMALAGSVGCEVRSPGGADHETFFGEDQGRYVVTLADPSVFDALTELSTGAGIAAPWIGETGGNAVSLGGSSVSLSDLRNAHEGWLPKFMGEG